MRGRMFVYFLTSVVNNAFESGLRAAATPLGAPSMVEAQMPHKSLGFQEFEGYYRSPLDSVRCLVLEPRRALAAVRRGPATGRPALT